MDAQSYISIIHNIKLCHNFVSYMIINNELFQKKLDYYINESFIVLKIWNCSDSWYVLHPILVFTIPVIFIAWMQLTYLAVTHSSDSVALKTHKMVNTRFLSKSTQNKIIYKFFVKNVFQNAIEN